MHQIKGRLAAWAQPEHPLCRFESHRSCDFFSGRMPSCQDRPLRAVLGMSRRKSCGRLTDRCWAKTCLSSRALFVLGATKMAVYVYTRSSLRRPTPWRRSGLFKSEWLSAPRSLARLIFIRRSGRRRLTLEGVEGLSSLAALRINPPAARATRKATMNHPITNSPTSFMSLAHWRLSASRVKPCVV